MDYLIDLKKQNLSGKVALEGGISLGVDTDGNIKKIDESGAISDIGGSIDESRLLKVPTSADEGKLPVIRADKIPAVYHDTTLAAIVIEGDKVIDKISGKELIKVGSPQIIDGGIHSPTNSDYYMLELDGVEGLPVAVSFDYQGDESLDNSDVLIINGNCSYYNLNGVSFCRTQGSGNNVKIDNQPISVSEAYRNYVMQVSSDNYESKTPPVAFIAGESKSPTYEGSFPSMSPLSSVKVCGRFGKIKNILISSAFPYTGNFTPRGDGVEGFGVPEKREPGWNYETLDEAANGRLLPENPANGDIPCFDATATIGGGNDASTKALLHFDAEVKDEAAGNAAPLALSSLNATIDTTVSKFGSGSLKLTSGHVFVPIPDLTAVNCVISCWVYLDSLPSSYSPLFCQDDDTAGSWNLAVDNSGIYMFCRGGTTKAKQPLQAKTWYWAAIVKSGKELRFYLNGAYIYSLTDSILRFTSPIIGIGEQTNEDGRKLTGNVDEFRIQFLTADELSAWTGLTIPVPVEAYSVVQTVGEWSKLNRAELVKSVNGQTPDSSGAVTLPEATTSAAGLMAAADKAAIAGLTAQGIYPNVAIATAGSGIDYNLFKTQGTFYIPYHTAVSNGPVSAGSNGVYPGGFLSILQANLSGGTSVQQIFHQHSSNNAYIRSYNGDLDIWTGWQRTLTAPDITESKARPGYFKLPGGIIVQWGAVSNVTADGNTAVVFPLAFPGAMLTGYASAASGTASAAGVVESVTVSSKTGMTLITKNHPGGDADINIYWLAIGY